VAAQNVIRRAQAGSGTDHEPILVIDGVGDGQTRFFSYQLKLLIS
jgi:hypothetical protein